METISAKDFEQRYGKMGTASFTQPTQAPQPATQSGSMADTVSNAFQGGINQFKKGYQQASQAKNPFEMTEAGGNELAGGIGAVFSPLAPITKPIGDAATAIGNFNANHPMIQQSEQQKINAAAPGGSLDTLSRGAEDVGNFATIAGTLAGGKGAGGVSSYAIRTGAKATAETASKVGSYAKGAIRDITPTTQGIISHQVTKALDLTPGDINKIHASTGNNIGPWLADNNLIGKNKEETQSNINSFFKDNYSQVRDEIGKVDTTYKPSQIPRFTDALKQIEKKVENTPGLEETWIDTQHLLAKKELTLNDVQHAKELLDKHFNLYKVTGDVGEGAAKEGLANMRTELKSFIEDQVQKHSGADIRQLNNHVSTAKSLNDAITTRAPKGLTASNVKMGDMATYFGFGGGLSGAAAVFVKKVSETPTVRLRIAKFLDQLDDKQKAKIQATMQAGNIPPEFNQFIKKPTGGSKK